MPLTSVHVCDESACAHALGMYAHPAQVVKTWRVQDLDVQSLSRTSLFPFRRSEQNIDPPHLQARRLSSSSKHEDLWVQARSVHTNVSRDPDELKASLRDLHADSRGGSSRSHPHGHTRGLYAWAPLSSGGGYEHGEFHPAYRGSGGAVQRGGGLAR